jgi:hypothetical protein
MKEDREEFVDSRKQLAMAVANRGRIHGAREGAEPAPPPRKKSVRSDQGSEYGIKRELIRRQRADGLDIGSRQVNGVDMSGFILSGVSSRQGTGTGGGDSAVRVVRQQRSRHGEFEQILHDKLVWAIYSWHGPSTVDLNMCLRDLRQI